MQWRSRNSRPIWSFFRTENTKRAAAFMTDWSLSSSWRGRSASVALPWSIPGSSSETTSDFSIGPEITGEQSTPTVDTAKHYETVRCGFYNVNPHRYIRIGINVEISDLTNGCNVIRADSNGFARSWSGVYDGPTSRRDEHRISSVLVASMQLQQPVGLLPRRNIADARRQTALQLSWNVRRAGTIYLCVIGVKCGCRPWLLIRCIILIRSAVYTIAIVSDRGQTVVVGLYTRRVKVSTSCFRSGQSACDHHRGGELNQLEHTPRRP